MQVGIHGMTGDLWVVKGGKRHGPFATVLDASYTAVVMVTDEINAEYAASPSAVFLDPKVKN